MMARGFAKMSAAWLIWPHVQGRGSRWLALRPLVGAGKIAYGLYLWQELFIGPATPGFAHIRTFPVQLTNASVVT
jgi:peptidoglycan/LPS O-acetylase OafA/YrhL